MKVLVLTGPESSGKSWLAGEIQARFGGVMVGEYVRHFIDEQQRDTCYADVAEIARGQLAWEDAARATRSPLVILDTHLLSNMLWSHSLFGDCPHWLEAELLARHYDHICYSTPQAYPGSKTASVASLSWSSARPFIRPVGIGCWVTGSVSANCQVAGMSGARLRWRKSRRCSA